MKKACRKCKVLVKSGSCPICKGTDLVTTWKGRVAMLDPEKSEVAKKLNLNTKGEYAIKIT